MVETRAYRPPRNFFADAAWQAENVSGFASAGDPFYRHGKMPAHPGRSGLFPASASYSVLHPSRAIKEDTFRMPRHPGTTQRELR